MINLNTFVAVADELKRLAELDRKIQLTMRSNRKGSPKLFHGVITKGFRGLCGSQLFFICAVRYLDQYGSRPCRRRQPYSIVVVSLHDSHESDYE